MRIKDIQVSPFNPSAGYFYIVNEEGVTYKANDLDDLIRFYVNHTQRKAIQVGSNGLSVSEQTN